MGDVLDLDARLDLAHNSLLGLSVGDALGGSSSSRAGQWPIWSAAIWSAAAPRVPPWEWVDGTEMT